MRRNNINSSVWKAAGIGSRTGHKSLTYSSSGLPIKSAREARVGERQWICSSAFTQRSYDETARRVNSSYVDYVEEGAVDISSPLNGSAVLYSWQSVPLALYDVPTLNGMVYRKSLWEKLMANPTLNSCIENKSFWGEAFHSDSDEVKIPDVAIRVSKWWIDSNNLILGDVDIMNTPNGAICYTLAKAGRIGTSTRGFGVLDDIGNGLTEVNEDQYVHICSDVVALPAVPEANLSTQWTADLTRNGIDSMSGELRAMLSNALKINPDNPSVLRLVASLSRTGRFTSVPSSFGKGTVGKSKPSPKPLVASKKPASSKAQAKARDGSVAIPKGRVASAKKPASSKAKVASWPLGSSKRSGTGRRLASSMARVSRRRSR